MIEPVKPLSNILEELLREDQPPLTVGEITDRVARRGFGLFMIVLALPTLIPVLPWGAWPIGLLYTFFAIQMLIGLDRPWLPKRVRKYHLSDRAVTALRTRGVPFLRRIERFSRPRAMVLDERIVLRLVAVVLLVLGVILVSPIPFLNTLPALSAMFLGVGLLNRDGLFLLIGVLLAVTVAAIIAFGGGILYGLFNDLLKWLRGR